MTRPLASGRRVIAIAFWLTLASCGPRNARPTNVPELAHLAETQALALVRQTLGDANVPSGPPFSLNIGDSTPLEVDVAFADGFGVEWVTASDRAEHPNLPPAPEGGQLRVVPGAGADAASQILMLDADSYRYDTDRERVQAGATSLMDVEARLRRDVRDFLVHVGL